MKTIKENIKEKSEKQTFFKNQRRTVRLVGERVLKPWEATMMHRYNRHELRLLHAAYGLMRGKTYHDIESAYPQETHPLREYESQIQKLVEEYEAKTVHTDE